MAYFDCPLTSDLVRIRKTVEEGALEALANSVPGRKRIKTVPNYPGWFPSSSIQVARNYFEDYFHWYNYEHFHSGIGYIHPIDKHEERAEIILNKRKECMNNQRRLRRLYWSEKNQITGSGL